QNMARPSAPGPVNPQIDHEVKIIAIGASAGGPPVLQRILAGLDADFPIPILIVQHMAPGFLPGMLNWLGETSRLPLRIAENGETMLPGRAYFAPDGFQTGVDVDNAIFLSAAGLEHGARPSISYLFRSVAGAYGGDAAAVLLSGMGRDGAAEMKLLREKGALTIAQDKESCAVYGIPEAAVRMDAAAMVLPPERIISTLAGLVKNRSARGK
ncbi:MAG: CheB methylesterase domain-containing protein, partial [Nitrospiraceae bacterium]|nr:CheB methylesterase domain-containing protein [Nitrospiraceae bacterium]